MAFLKVSMLITNGVAAKRKTSLRSSFARLAPLFSGTIPKKSQNNERPNWGWGCVLMWFILIWIRFTERL